MKEPHLKSLEKAKIQLMLLPNTTFYASILFSLRQEWTEDIPTAGVDGISLLINPVWFQALTAPQRIGLIIHEILHVAMSHITRKGNRDHTIWNVAGDYLINDSIKRAKYELPPQALHDKKYTNNLFNTESLYTKLYAEAPKDPNGNPIPDPNGIPGIGQDVMCPKTPVANNTTQQHVADILVRATMAAKDANDNPGSMPGEIQIELQKVINPKLPWTTILQNFMSNFAKDDYTWTRPNKKFMPTFYLPTAHSEAIIDLTIAVDSSGSVTDEEFSYFIAEIAAIQQQLKPDKITLIDFDTRINSIQEISQNTNILKDLKFKGGGGTRLRDVFKWAQKNNPTVLLVFTDGEFDTPNKKHWPKCPIVWLIHNDPHFKIPIGKVIHYDLHV